MDKVCATCGKQLQADHAFCDQCGSPWTASAVPGPQAAASAAVGSGKTIGVIALIVVVALALGGWLFATHRVVAAPAVDTDSAAAITPPVTASASQTTIDAITEAATKSKQCSLISPADMGAILGKKIVKVTNTEMTCAYFTDAEASAQVDTTWTGGKAAMAETKGFNSAEGLFVPVAGIGDEAYSQAAGVLHVLKGDTYVVVNSREYPNELEIESAIAKKIMEKMQ